MMIVGVNDWIYWYRQQFGKYVFFSRCEALQLNCQNYPVDRSKDATVGITEGTHDLSKQALCLEKLISDENKATFSVIKRRKMKELLQMVEG